MNFDPLRPYVGLAKVIGWLLLASVLLFGGCSWGRSMESAKVATKLASKDAALRDAAQQLRNAATALHQVNLATAQDEAASAERMREADFEKERAKMAAADLEKKLAVAEQDLIDAMRDPGCRADLEKPVCAALR